MSKSLNNQINLSDSKEIMIEKFHRWSQILQK